MTTSTPRAHKRPFGDSYLNIHLYQKTSSKKEKKVTEDWRYRKPKGRRRRWARPRPLPSGSCPPTPGLGGATAEGAPGRAGEPWPPLGPSGQGSSRLQPGRGSDPTDHVQVEGHQLAPKLPLRPASRNGVRQRKSEIRSRGDQLPSIALLPTAGNVGCHRRGQLVHEGATERGPCHPALPRGRR